MMCHDFAPIFFLSHCAGNFRRGVFKSFPNFGSRETLGIKKAGRESRLSGQIVLSRNTATIPRGTLLSCVSVKPPVAKKAYG